MNKLICLIQLIANAVRITSVEQPKYEQEREDGKPQRSGSTVNCELLHLVGDQFIDDSRPSQQSFIYSNRHKTLPSGEVELQNEAKWAFAKIQDKANAGTPVMVEVVEFTNVPSFVIMDNSGRAIPVNRRIVINWNGQSHEQLEAGMLRSIAARGQFQDPKNNEVYLTYKLTALELQEDGSYAKGESKMRITDVKARVLESVKQKNTASEPLLKPAKKAVPAGMNAEDEDPDNLGFDFNGNKI